MTKHSNILFKIFVQLGDSFYLRLLAMSLQWQKVFASVPFLEILMFSSFSQTGHICNTKQANLGKNGARNLSYTYFRPITLYSYFSSFSAWHPKIEHIFIQFSKIYKIQSFLFLNSLWSLLRHHPQYCSQWVCSHL